MGKIFICYRRDDSQHQAGRIYDRLVARFGAESVFWDVDAIPFAVKFPERIQTAIAECDVLLALIGEQWLDIRDAKGNRRLDDAGDYVRQEIEEALRQGVTAVPVLLDDASMPSKDDLPPTCRVLAEINAPRVRAGSDFNHHVKQLLDSITGVIAARERQRAEEQAARRRAEEQAERERIAAERGRAAAPAAAGAEATKKDLYRPFSFADFWISLVAIVPWYVACYYADFYMPGERSGVAVLLITAAYLGLAFWQIIRWRQKTGQSTPMDEIRKWRRK